MIQHIILSVNELQEYRQHLPRVIAAWEDLMGITPDVYDTVESPGPELVGMPTDGMPTSSLAKISRYALAATFPDEICMLSDVDMLPLRADPFKLLGRVAEQYPDHLTCYGADLFEHVDPDEDPTHGVLPVCYLAGRGSVFGKLFANQPDDWNDWTQYRGNPYADNFCDEAMLRYMGIRDITMGISRGYGPDGPDGLVAGRIDRRDWRPDLLDHPGFIDAHLPRTM
jgi:hypothetical protein